MTDVNDLNVWIYLAPFISTGDNRDFTTWFADAPVVDQDEGATQDRRRVDMF